MEKFRYCFLSGENHNVHNNKIGPQLSTAPTGTNFRDRTCRLKHLDPGKHNLHKSRFARVLGCICMAVELSKSPTLIRVFSMLFRIGLDYWLTFAIPM